MTFEPRSSYEYGDPVADLVAREEATDHARARARGERLALLVDAIVSALHARALLTDPGIAKVLTFHVLADHLYGTAAIDIPPRRDEESMR